MSTKFFNQQIKLKDYLLLGKYKLHSEGICEYATVDDLLNIADGNARVIGIDGPTLSGKTSLAESIKTSKYPICIIHTDIFLIDREKRKKIFEQIRNGDLPIARYSELAWQQDKIHDTISAAKAIVSSGKTKDLTITAVYNRNTGGNDYDSRFAGCQFAASSNASPCSAGSTGPALCEAIPGKRRTGGTG